MGRRDFKPEPARDKEKRMTEKSQFMGDLRVQQRQFEERNEPHIQVLFWNLGLGKQRYAHHFWVYLPRELPGDDIEERMKRAFQGC